MARLMPSMRPWQTARWRPRSIYESMTSFGPGKPTRHALRATSLSKATYRTMFGIGVLDRVPIAIGAAIAGWCLGWLSAWLSDWLIAKDESPAAERDLLIRDPLVQGGSALV